HRLMFGVPPNKGAAFWAQNAEGIEFAELDGPMWRENTAPLQTFARERRSYGSAPKWNDPAPRLRTDVTNPNQVVVRSDGAVPGDAILAMSWYPGWELEGEPVEWLNAVHARIP